jgi:hypothetical protein
MFNNPFTPLFGGKPDVFFGHDDILNNFSMALRDNGSDYRSLFITGIRGNGKTALLERLSGMAEQAKFRVIDASAQTSLHAICRQLIGVDESSKTLEPELEANIGGVGGKVKIGAKTSSIKYDKRDIGEALLAASKKEKRGLLITIDESQKVPLEDMSIIANAFQMASRKGADVLLAVAGLPYAYDDIIHHEGATFLRRGAHVELTLFNRDTVNYAFEQVFAEVKGLTISQNAMDVLVSASKGHPYIMQVLGYCLISQINESNNLKKYDVTVEDAQKCVNQAIAVYKERAIRPIITELTSSELAYLRAAASAGGAGQPVATADIAKSLGKTLGQTSAARASLLRDGLLVASSQGKVMMTVPYMREYLQQDVAASNVVELAKEWSV